MAKKQPKVKNSKAEAPKQNAYAKEIQRESDLMIKNGLGEALGLADTGFGLFGMGAQLSQVETLFQNNRWYLVSNMRQLLSEIYVEHGVIQNVVDVPVDDAFRGGIEIQSKQLGEENIKQLLAHIEREDDLGVLAQGAKWNRLYGGAGILIVSEQKADTPFKTESIVKGSKVAFRAVDMWELFYDKQNIEADGFDPEIQLNKTKLFNYYGKLIDESRVMKMKGLTPPSFIRPRLRGWGFSIVEAFVRSLNQYLKATDLSFEVLDEFKLDVFKLKNLTQTLFQANGEAKVRTRVQMANAQKNYQNALVLDSEDDFDHKQLSFSGLAEVMEGIKAQLASDLRMSRIKLFGQGPSGLNASGEDEIEVYNSMVESQVRSKIKFEALHMLEIRCQQLFGMVPTDLMISFKPLRVLSAEQEENVKTQKFNRTLAAKTAGEITSLEFRQAVNKDNLLPIQLDLNAVDLLADEQTDDNEAEEDVDPSEKKEDSKMMNSLKYDEAAFEADGGLGQFPAGKGPLYEDDFRFRDKDKYKQACEVSMGLYGKHVWQFILWKYKSLGGTVI